MDLKREIEMLKERNRHVEGEKAWEVSVARRFVVALFTYVVAGAWLLVIENAHPWLSAFVPTGGYLLSTLSLPLFKKWWIKKSPH